MTIQSTTFAQPIAYPYYYQEYISAHMDLYPNDATVKDYHGYTASNCPGHKGCVYDNHGGTDYAAPEGTDVYAAYSGTVIDVVNNYVGNTYPNGTITSGNRVVIDTGYTGNGYRYYLRYSHLKTGSVIVSKDDVVNTLQRLGQVNNTGYSGGNHLHFSVRRNQGSTIVDSDSYSIDPYQTKLLTEPTFETQSPW